jgi:glutamine synthetase
LKREGIEFLPTTLAEALDHFEQDEVLRDAIGQGFSEMYLRAKRNEWNAYNRTVSQWELDNYLALY